MEILYGLIKIDKEILLSNNFFITALLAILLVFLFILLLLKPTVSMLLSIKKAYFSVPRIRKKEDWVARSRERKGWLQGAVAQVLNLDGKYLKELVFTVQPIGKPKNWRGGFILGNPTFVPNVVVDNLNAITCHIGSHDLEETTPVWIFDKEHDRNNAYNTLVKSLDSDYVDFSIKISDNNFLTIEVNGQVVYAEGIDSSFRKKLYLIAWGDGVECEVKFSKIIYYITN